MGSFKYSPLCFRRSKASIPTMTYMITGVWELTIDLQASNNTIPISRRIWQSGGGMKVSAWVTGRWPRFTTLLRKR